ncbi:MAG TPA: glycerophosphodiester phosphodiesterase family protein, partial [Myxococcota bacterium]|nr:glycerophosphodiester phosphodiesterase family protein [Myxococcota bacterium]
MLTLSAEPSARTDGYPPVAPGALIAHALGAIDGRAYTNSLEAFQISYANGRRIFEVDFQLTSDGQLVCVHDGVEQQVGLSQPIGNVTAAEFLTHKWMGRFTLMTLAQLLELLEAHQDALIVTDTKGWSAAVAKGLERALVAVDAQLVSRIIPQIYNPADLALVRGIESRLGRFRSLVFTLYMSRMSNAEVAAFVATAQIPLVAFPVSRADPAFVALLRQGGAQALVHTVNEHADIFKLARMGV